MHANDTDHTHGRFDRGGLGRRFLALVLTITVLAAGMSGSASATTDASISGTVTDHTGAPIEGMLVYLYDTGYAGYTFTDPTGAYTFDGLAAGTYKVRFNGNSTFADEWYDDAPNQASATPIAVGESEAVTGIDAELASGSISGTVTDHTGAPIAGMLVYVYGTGIAGNAFTDASGVYTVGALTPGTYTVHFNGNSTFADEWYDDAPNQGSATPIAVGESEAVTGIDAELASGSISGTVTDVDGAPIEDMLVYVYDSGIAGYAWTDATGVYTVGALPAGTYTVHFNGNSTFADEWYDDAPNQGSATPVAVGDSEAVTGIDAELASGSISGTVTDIDGAPIEDALVYVYDSGIAGYAFTDAAGGYTVGALSAGTYTVRFSPPDPTTKVTEWYDDAPDQASSTPVSVGLGAAVSGIDAALSDRHLIRPFGVVANPEGDSGTTTHNVLVYVEDTNGDPFAATEELTIDWYVGDVPSNPLIAHPGEDIVAASGTLTIPEGATTATIPVEVIGDTVDEPPLLYGEWALIGFNNPSRNAALETQTFFGIGLVIIIDDD